MHSLSTNVVIFRKLNGKLLLSVDLLRIVALRIVLIMENLLRNLCKLAHFQVTEDIGSDELIRRLKTLAHTFQTLSQADDESTYADYTPLAIHLADDGFLTHHSRDVQLLIACCVADILRCASCLSLQMTFGFEYVIHTFALETDFSTNRGSFELNIHLPNKIDLTPNTHFGDRYTFCIGGIFQRF